MAASATNLSIAFAGILSDMTESTLIMTLEKIYSGLI